ncbi:SIMPL domain-containing protein [Streptomyces broussonetiae]|uniref:DUF541 domain-containing protein n=1 Tax=Streptomyces broussonetiae TaxID=2686304 RepID=A0A6I6N8A1_9ACTN|nr:SIMPL domain-containing protein [Streptomyces broussonetiae]QHA04666.1 DUF541 domain-containing protein [Streptomyces broussonetiae]
MMRSRTATGSVLLATLLLCAAPSAGAAPAVADSALRAAPVSGAPALETVRATGRGRAEGAEADRETLVQRARTAALADARSKAEQYARSEGRRLGRLVSVTEVPSGHAPASGRLVMEVDVAASYLLD